MTTTVDKFLIPKELKKTTKYTHKDHKNVEYLYDNGMAIRAIAREIPMSRRMVQFILFPDRLALAKKNFAKRQKDKRYRYPTKIQTAMVKTVRNRKKLIIDKLIPNNAQNKKTATIHRKTSNRT